MNMRIHLCLAGCLLFTAAGAGASDNSAPPDKAALEAAMQACAASVAIGADGKPNMQAMEACMSAKGFTRPSGPPSDGGRGGPPPSR